MFCSRCVWAAKPLNSRPEKMTSRVEVTNGEHRGPPAGTALCRSVFPCARVGNTQADIFTHERINARDYTKCLAGRAAKGVPRPARVP